MCFRLRINLLERKRDEMVMENNKLNEMGKSPRWNVDDFATLKREAAVLLSVFESGKDLAKTREK